MTALEVVHEFWRLMGTNDFQAVGAVLSDDSHLEYPLSNERIVGRVNVAGMNAEYPAHGPWRFSLNRAVATESEVVTDGLIVARAITFSTVRNGQITRQVEFWPETTGAPANRSHWVEPIRSND